MWHFNWGFVGAPVAVVVTDNLLPVFLLCYVKFIDGGECWNGFTVKDLQNWGKAHEQKRKRGQYTNGCAGPIIKLSIPGLFMVEAEYFAFEILTLAASYFSTTHLAAQTALSTLTALTFQIPFSMSIAASTRITNLIGARAAGPARTAAKVAGQKAPASGKPADGILGNDCSLYDWQYKRCINLSFPRLHCETVHPRR